MAIEKLGIRIYLMIKCPLFWSDEDIGRTWLAAVDGDYETLADWVDRGAGPMYPFRIPKDRYTRILNLVFEDVCNTKDKTKTDEEG